MPLKFKNLTEVLAFQLEEMYVAEKTVQKVLPRALRSVSSKKLRSEYKKYLESAADKRLKLKRTFSYLLIRPVDRNSSVTLDILKQIQAIAKSPTIIQLKDVQLLSSLVSLSQYKSSVYGTAMLFAEELELVTAAELLSQIISWENETLSALRRIALGSLAREAASL